MNKEIKDDVLNEYLNRLEYAIRFNKEDVNLTFDEQLQLLNDCKLLIKEIKECISMRDYYKSEYINVAHYWKDEINAHRNTKNELKIMKLRYKDLYNKYYLLIESRGYSNADNL